MRTAELNPCVADRARVVGRFVDRLRDDCRRVDRKEHVVIRKRVPVEVQVDTDLEHRERRSLRGINQRSPGLVPPTAIEAAPSPERSARPTLP